MHDKVTFYGEAGEGRMLSLEKNGSLLEWGLVTGKMDEFSDAQETEPDGSEAETEPLETETGSDEEKAETEVAETTETETTVESAEQETGLTETETGSIETETITESEGLPGDLSEADGSEELSAAQTEVETEPVQEDATSSGDNEAEAEASRSEGTEDSKTENITVTGQEQASLSSASFKVSYDDPASREAEKEHRTKLKSKSVSGTLAYTSEDLPIKLEYWLAGHDVKEDLVLLSPKALEENDGSFFFRLHLEDCTVKAYDEKAIVVLDPNGEALYYIFAPYMQDAAGSESTALTLAPEKETEKGTWLIRLTPDADWIRDPERVFPVTIDPTLGFSYQSFDTLIGTNIYSGMPDTGHCDTGTHYIGRADGYGNMRSAIKLPDLPELSESDMVIYSSVKFRVSGYDAYPGEGGNIVMNLHEFTQSVNFYSLTWNNHLGKFSDEVIDSQYVTPSETGSEPWITWDITKAVKDWYRSGHNYGLLFQSDNESASTRRVVSLYSASSLAAQPVFYISYLNQEGLESYLTCHSAGSDTMGTINVCDFNGNLIYTYNDLSMTGAYVPVSISHVYNHSRRGVTDLVNTSMRFGAGMRLNLSMRILSSDVTGYPYKLVDGDGTVHYFKLKSGTSGAAGSVYEKEFESTTTITIYSDEHDHYKLEDGSTTAWYFNQYGYLYRIVDLTKDKSQQMGNAGGKLNSVTDGGGRTTTLSYNSNGYLTGITDPAGRTTSYSYDTNHNLSQITRPDGKKVYLTYGQIGDKYGLTKVTDIDGSYITIEYYGTAPYRVKALKEYGSDSSHTAGNTLTWTYTAGETKITDRWSRSETMMFDNSGHTVTVRSHRGDAVFGSYKESDDNKKHALMYSSKMQAPVRNHLRNHGFESASGSPWYSPWGRYNAGDYVTAVLATQEFYEGRYALRIDNIRDDKRYGIYQNVTIPGVQGQYVTISGYVQFPSSYSPSEGHGFQLLIRYQDAAGDWVAVPGPIVSSGTGWHRYSWSAKIPDTASSETIQACYVNCQYAGTFWLDCTQAEVGAVANRYNLVNNGHFYDSAGTSVPEYWSGINLTGSDTVAAGRSGNGFRVSGKADTNKGLYQSIKIKDGHANDCFVFGGWAKAAAIPKDSQYHTGTKRDFAVRIRFIKADDTYEDKIVNFEAKSPNWQYVSGSAIAPFNYDRINITILYYFQKNTAYFDDLEVFRESFGDILTYDDKGRVTKIKDASGGTTTYTYRNDASQDLSQVKYPDGGEWNYTYSGRNIDYVTDKSGKTFNYAYDTNNNLKQTALIVGDDYMAGPLTAYSGSYVSSVTDPFGNVTAYSYNNSKGTLTSMTDPKGTVTNYTYDSNTDQLTEAVSGSSAVHYTYTNTRLTSLYHKTGSGANDKVTYGLTYNGFGTQSDIKIGTHSLASYSYEENNGNLSQTLYGNGQKLIPSYDTLGRITAMRYNSGSGSNVLLYRYYYRTDGNIGYIEDVKNDVQWRYEYDQGGRITSARSSLGEWHQYTYNSTTGELTKHTYMGNGSSTASSSQYSYEAYNNNGERLLTKITFNGGPLSLEYGYDSFYRGADKTAKILSGASIATHYTYRFDGVSGAERKRSPVPREIRQTVKNGVGTQTRTSELKYSYDSVGNITKVLEGSTEKARYTYDPLNQLTREDNAWLNKSFTYSYDQGGNITQTKEYPYTTGTLGTATATHTYTYGDANWKDKLTAYDGNTITYDAIGNPLSYRGMTFTWENGRQLKSAAVGGQTVQFRYDTSGVRIGKTAGSTTWKYTVENGKVLYENNGSIAIRYYYDENGSPFAVYIGSAKYLYEKNLQGDIIGLIDENGQLAVKYTYDAWGKVTKTNVAGTTASTSAMTNNHLLYRGYYFDSETGLYYLGSRYYDSETGRFINADDTSNLGANGDLTSLNLFTYCGNNPVSRIDSQGDFWEAIAIGFGVGLAGQYVSDVIGNIANGKTGIDVFKPTSSATDYLASGAGGAIAAIPGLGAIGTMAVGAIGNFTTDAFKGDIHSVADAGRSMASGSLANGFGFVVSKAVAITKVCKVDQMPRTARKAFLRDEVFHNSQAMVNQNLRSFRNYSFFKRVAKIENSSPILKSGIYSSLTSTIALMLR